MRTMYDREHESLVAQLRSRLDELMKKTGIEEDQMPIDEGVKSELPDEAIR